MKENRERNKDRERGEGGGERERERERGVCSNLPQVQTDDSKVLVSIEELVCLVLWVGDLRVHPLSLVVGVVNLSWFPVTCIIQGRKISTSIT